MKKILLYSAVVSSLFTACQKDDSSPTSAAATQSRPQGSLQASLISPVPSSFVTKVLAEEYVGTQYGLTPEASYDLYQVTKASRAKVYSVALHVNDVMATYQTSLNLRTLSSSPSFPSGTINRSNYNGSVFLDSKDYMAAVSAKLQRPVPCGLAISSTANGNLSASIDVHAGFAGTLSGNYRVMTYLVEDRVTTSNPMFAQTNSSNNLAGSVFYRAGNPITNYTNYNVLRRCISAGNGDAINNAFIHAGGQQVFSYRIDLPAPYCSTSHFKIIAFIIDSNTQEVITVQQADLNSVKDWN